MELHLPIDLQGVPLDGDPRLLPAVLGVTSLAPSQVAAVVIRKRSIDLRRRRQPMWVLRCDVFLRPSAAPDLALPPLLRTLHLAKKPQGLSPIIVGMGPAGLFAAIAFAEAGVRCIVLERGQAVEPRALDVRDLRVHGQLHEESNLCYGEGGAGTFSDGKLYTRSKHPFVPDIYARLVALGADPDISVAAHPHVGSNRLIPMMKTLREALREAGHELRFGQRMTDLLQDGHGRVCGVRLDDGTELQGTHVILATGHSARDTYRLLAQRGVALQRKDFAIGARVEHPQALVDQAQLGELAGHPALGAAEYFLRQQVSVSGQTQGVYSFCMCPGGFILPSPTQADRLNVNGMSNANRGSGFANAALVTQVAASEFYWQRPGDLAADADFGDHVAGGALAGVALQERLEKACFSMGGGAYAAPTQRLTDFVRGQASASLPARMTYRPGAALGRIDQLLPRRVVAALAQGAKQVEQGQFKGYLSQEAVIVGVETTTSSPVRIVRGADRQSVSHPGLYPCAEGAGYAGGIVSSAIDGYEAALAILQA